MTMANAGYSPNNILSAGWIRVLWLETTWQTLVWEMLWIRLCPLLLQCKPPLCPPPIRPMSLNLLPPNIAYKLNGCTCNLHSISTPAGRVSG